ELKRKIKKAKQEANEVKVSVTNAAKDKNCIRSYLPELRLGTTSSLSLTYAITEKDKNIMLAYLPSSSQIESMTIGRCKEVESLAAATAFQEAKDAPQPSSCGSSANLLYEDGALNCGSLKDSFAAIPLKKRGNLNGGISNTL
ncbi:hypothetical protein QYM36_019948, partial [Artemia franciscana]